jgi:hypothetical protein
MVAKLGTLNQRVGEGRLPTQTLDKKKDFNCKRQVGLYNEENKRGMHPEEL